MDSTIGRKGIRLLALFTLAIGALGMAVVWNALGSTGPLAVLGLGIVGLALVGLTFIVFPATAGPPRVTKARKDRKDKREARLEKALEKARGETLWEAEEAPDVDVVGAPPQGELTFTDIEEPVAPHPAVMADSEPARTDPRDWPVRAKASHPTAPVYQPTKRADLQKKYTQTTPLVRGILEGAPGTAVYEEIPEIVAQVAVPGSGAPDGHTLGRCGGCQTVVVAPTTRPVRVRCARCSRTQLLR